MSTPLDLNPVEGAGISPIDASGLSPGGGSVIRVLVWAKSPFMRAGLETAVCGDGRFEIVEHDHTIDLATACRDKRPDIVLLESAEIDVFRTVAEISSEPRGPAFAVLATNANRSELLRLVRSGARAILHSDSSPVEISDALQAVSNGLAVFSAELLEILLPGAEATEAEPFLLQESLTSRETEVLALLAGGAGNKEIAAKLGISEHTAKFHVSSILGKLGATTRTEAVTRGYRLGLIMI